MRNRAILKNESVLLISFSHQISTKNTIQTTMASIDPADEAQRRNLAWIQTMINPSLPPIAPPQVAGRSFMPQDCLVDGTFQVDDTTIGASVCKVPTAKGLIMYTPFTGTADCIRRYGFVPKGTAVPWGSLLGTPALSPLGLNQPCGNATVGPATQATLVFDEELIVPYNDLQPGQTVTIGPDLSEEFGYAMNIAGRISISAASLPAGQFQLSGWMSAGAVQSTEDLAQTDSGAYTDVGIQTSSVSSKEYVLKVQGLVGVTATQGPDIRNLFVPPDTGRQDYTNGLWAGGNGAGFFDGSASCKSFSFNIDNVDIGNNVHCGGWVITPWKLHSVPIVAVPTNDTMTIITPPIGETDVLDTDIVLSPKCSINGAASDAQVTFVVIATHVFATCGNDHEVRFLCEHEQQDVGTFTAATAGGMPDMAAPYIAKMRPKKYMQSQTVQGKYLFTLAQCFAHVTGCAAGTVLATISWPKPARLFVRSHAQAEQEKSGPARILTWSGMQNQQAIRLEGVLQTLVVSRARIAKYVKKAIQAAEQAVSFDATIFAQQLWKSANPLARVYNTANYWRVVREYAEGSMDIPVLLKLINGEPRTLALAQTAGFFSNLLNRGRQLARSIIPHVVDAATALQSFTGQPEAAGEWGEAEAAGSYPFNSAGAGGGASGGQMTIFSGRRHGRNE